MGTKKHVMTVRIDREDVEFLDGLGLFESKVEAIRFCIKLTRLYSIPAIRALGEKQR
jgi:hypothetical protein